MKAFEITTRRTPRTRSTSTGVRFGQDIETVASTTLRVYRRHDPETVLVSIRELPPHIDPRRPDRQRGDTNGSEITTYYFDIPEDIEAAELMLEGESLQHLADEADGGTVKVWARGEKGLAWAYTDGMCRDGGRSDPEWVLPNEHAEFEARGTEDEVGDAVMACIHAKDVPARSRPKHVRDRCMNGIRVIDARDARHRTLAVEVYVDGNEQEHPCEQGTCEHESQFDCIPYAPTWEQIAAWYVNPEIRDSCSVEDAYAFLSLISGGQYVENTPHTVQAREQFAEFERRAATCVRDEASR